MLEQPQPRAGASRGLVNPGPVHTLLVGKQGEGLVCLGRNSRQAGKGGQSPEPQAEGGCVRTLWEGFPGGWGSGLRQGAACSDASGVPGLGQVWRLQDPEGVNVRDEARKGCVFPIFLGLEAQSSLLLALVLPGAPAPAC